MLFQTLRHISTSLLKVNGTISKTRQYRCKTADFRYFPEVLSRGNFQPDLLGAWERSSSHRCTDWVHTSTPTEIAMHTARQTQTLNSRYYVRVGSEPCEYSGAGIGFPESNLQPCSLQWMYVHTRSWGGVVWYLESVPELMIFTISRHRERGLPCSCFEVTLGVISPPSYGLNSC